MALFPLDSLDDLTDDGLHELAFQVQQELEARGDVCTAEEADYEDEAKTAKELLPI